MAFIAARASAEAVGVVVMGCLLTSLYFLLWGAAVCADMRRPEELRSSCALQLFWRWSRV
jgi:hypothetical protein